MSSLDYDGLDYHTGKFKTWVKKLLEGKSNTGHKHTKSDITDFPNLGTASSKDIASNGNASTTQVVMGNDTRLTDARKASDVSAWAKAAAKPTYTASEVGAYTKSETDTKLNSKINTSLKGSANGLAELDSNGKVPYTQLPSFVDDVIEGYLSSGKFYKESAHTTQISGESGKIYIDLSTEKTYRWSGSAFVVISETLALGETSSTAYRGDRGKTAYDHSQSTHARIDATNVEKSSTNGNIKINGTETTVYTHPSGTNPHGTTKSDVGLGNVGNFKAVSTVSNQGLSDTEKSNARSNIGAQVAGSYASSTHTHDDRYYTESEIDSKLGGKANSSHTHTKSQITDFPTSMPANGGNSTTVNGHTVNSNVPANAKFTDTTYNIATTTANGLMSKEDKTKLNGLDDIESVKSFIPLFGTTKGQGLITDALNVDLTSAEGNANKVGYVSKGSTTNLPTSVEWGIREVFYYNESNVIVKITGWDNQVSQITSWYNIYSSGSWVGWTKQLTDKGGQMNGELKLSYGSSIANGAYVPSSTTVESLCNEISKSSGCSGSVSLVKCTWNNVVIPAGWYNYLYIPHRTGGKNGAENGDNHQYGTLLLFGMTSSIFSQCFRVAWQGNKVANIEMILSASDGFSDTLLASRTGRLYVYSNTKGDVVTTNGRSAISATGAKSIIIKGTLGLPDSEPGNLYGGHMIISVEGKGSWLDNDANDNWGLDENPLTYITPCGNTVYIYHMAGSWAYDGYPTSFVTLANGEQYSITDSCGFFGVNHTENNYRYFKLMLSIADTVLFNSSYNSLQNVNIRQLSEGVKSLYPSKATNSNITLGSNSLHYFIANSGTAYRPENGCILHAAWNNTNGWDKQLMLGDSRLWYRSQSDGTWGDWVRVADSKYGLNYNGSYNLISHNTSTQTMYSSGIDNETGLTGTNIGNTTYNTRINSNWYMYLYSTGKISANQNISIASDEKVKDFSNNLETDYDSLIKIFDIIQPKSYKYKYSKLNSESIGFCAQEVEDAFKSENIDPSKYSVLNIQYNYMMSRGDTEEDFKYYTKFMEISYNDLYNLSILKIKDMEEKHTSKLENLETRLSALENKEA